MHVYCSNIRGKGTETDPSHVIQRSSYSYVVNRASVKRPLGMRGLSPTPTESPVSVNDSGKATVEAAYGERRSGGADNGEAENTAANNPPAQRIDPVLATSPIEGLAADRDNYSMLTSPSEASEPPPTKPPLQELDESTDEDEVPTADGLGEEPVTESCVEDGISGDGGAESSDQHGDGGEEEEEDAEDDGEDFQVLSDRSPTDTSTTSSQHRAARVKNRSIEGDMLPDFSGFKEVYDDAEGEVCPPADGDTTPAAAEASPPEAEVPYSYPPSGKDVAFI
jgi:hypothetical protein